MTASNAGFKRSLNKFVKKTNGKLDTIVRKVTLDMYRELVLLSPVDTGRFRRNWFIQHEVLPVTRDDKSKSGAPAIEEASTEILRFKAGDGIFIANHLPYAMELEFGSSKQAPQGMVRITVAQFERYLRSAIATIARASRNDITEV